MTTKKEEAYKYIKREIISNNFKPGTLIKEIELSEILEMSRTPIREAIRDLEAEGLVETYPARGTVVSIITEQDVQEIFELRVLLECWALEKSIHMIQVEELDLIENKFKEAYSDDSWEKFHEADRLLHQLITIRAGKKRLNQFINTLNTQIERIRRLSTQDPQRKSDSFNEHMGIIKFLRMKDIEMSKTTLTNHLQCVSTSAKQHVHHFSIENSEKLF